MPKTKKQNRVKKYAMLVKANPIQAYLDLVNLVLVIAIFVVLFSVFTWIESVFQGNTCTTPIIAKLSGFPIYWHGIILAIGILAGLAYVALNHKKMKIKHDHIVGIAFWAILMGIIGGRAGFVLANWGLYSNDILQALNIWGGGISFYGAIILGGLAAISYASIRKVDIKKVLDLLAPAMFLGLAIGSWGSFFNQEKIGKPTYSFLKMFVQPESRPWVYQKFSFFHPIFFYESIAFIILFFVLLKIKNRAKLESGSLFALSIFLYSVVKFALGFLSVEAPLISVFNLEQIVSIIFALIALTGLLILRRKNDKN